MIRLDVLTNVMCGRLYEIPTLRVLLKWFTPTERALALHALGRLGLSDLAMNRADALSGGQQQRVAIARALMQRPRTSLGMTRSPRWTLLTLSWSWTR